MPRGRPSVSPWGSCKGRRGGRRFPSSMAAVGLRAQIDLAATAGEDRFDLEGRLLAIDLPPLGILLTASFRGLGVLTRLSLGPVRLDIARGWGEGGRRRVTVSVFPVERIFGLGKGRKAPRDGQRISGEEDLPPRRLGGGRWRLLRVSRSQVESWEGRPLGSVSYHR